MLGMSLPMKTHYVKRSAFAVAGALCLGIIFTATISWAAEKKSEAPAQNSGDMAQLIVGRNPSVGSGITVTLSVDGKQVSKLAAYDQPIAYYCRLAPYDSGIRECESPF